MYFNYAVDISATHLVAVVNSSCNLPKYSPSFFFS